MAWLRVESRFVSTLLAVLFACSPDAKDDGQAEGDADDGGNDTSGTGAADDDGDDDDDGNDETPADDGDDDDGAETTGTAEEDDGNDDVSFVLPPDGGAANECDPKAQDCPRGQKCTAWANDGGTFWNANRCVEISGEGVAGDACMVEGSGVSGIDSCGLGSICLNTDQDGNGTCIAFCEGENEDCNPGSVCAIYNDGVLPICLVQCDPLLQDCPQGQGCIDTPNGQFICFTDASGSEGAAGDACPPEDGENSCDPGLWCGQGGSGCPDVNCCTPYCDLSEANPCAAPDECVSFYGDPGSAPPEYMDVGVCVLPA